MPSTALDRDQAYERIAQILGCKWSLLIFDRLATKERVRPSEILKSADGLAPRVLHRCLSRLERDGLLAKEVFAEIPPRTEYALTEQGRRFVQLLDDARGLAATWTGDQPLVTAEELATEEPP